MKIGSLKYILLLLSLVIVGASTSNAATESPIAGQGGQCKKASAPQPKKAPKQGIVRGKGGKFKVILTVGQVSGGVVTTADPKEIKCGNTFDLCEKEYPIDPTSANQPSVKLTAAVDADKVLIGWIVDGEDSSVTESSITVTLNKSKVVEPKYDDSIINVPTPTPTAVQTVAYTHTPTATPTRTPTATVTGTHTPTITATPTITSTPTKTATATKTSTYTPTSTPTRTATKTPTPTKTASPTVTQTPTKTATPAPPICDSSYNRIIERDNFGFNKSQQYTLGCKLSKFTFVGYNCHPAPTGHVTTSPGVSVDCGAPVGDGSGAQTCTLLSPTVISTFKIKWDQRPGICDSGEWRFE